MRLPAVEIPCLFVMIFRGMFLFGAALYVLAGAVYALCRLTVGERVVVVTLGNVFLHWFLLLSLLLLPVALLMRVWWMSGALGGFLAAFVALYGGLFLPPSATVRAQGGMPLRVMTYNTAAFYTHPDDLIALLRELDADVVALVELNKINADRLERDLANAYPYRVLEGGGTHGKGLLSRYPIGEHNVFQIATDRPNIHAVLQVGQAHVNVYVVHPPSPDFNRRLNFYTPDPANRAEIEHLIAEAPGNTPALLLGDFNFTDQSPVYRIIRRQGYQDAFREAGYGFGGTFHQRAFPVGGGRSIWLWRDPAVARIDYVWHSSHFTAARAFVGSANRSDHAPVIADLRLRES